MAMRKGKMMTWTRMMMERLVRKTSRLWRGRWYYEDDDEVYSQSSSDPACETMSSRASLVKRRSRHSPKSGRVSSQSSLDPACETMSSREMKKANEYRQMKKAARARQNEEQEAQVDG